MSSSSVSDKSASASPNWKAFGETLGGMAGVRNILVHEYLDVDHDRLYTIMSRNLGGFGKFIRVILKLL